MDGWMDGRMTAWLCACRGCCSARCVAALCAGSTSSEAPTPPAGFLPSVERRPPSAPPQLARCVEPARTPLQACSSFTPDTPACLSPRAGGGYGAVRPAGVNLHRAAAAVGRAAGARGGRAGPGAGAGRRHVCAAPPPAGKVRAGRHHARVHARHHAQPAAHGCAPPATSCQALPCAACLLGKRWRCLARQLLSSSPPLTPRPPQAR